MLKLFRNEAWATARCALYRFEKKPQNHNPLADPKCATLIVHGLMGRAPMFYPMAHYLKGKGVTPIHFVEYPSQSTTINDIIEGIQSILSVHPSAQWNIVAHSLGAVATRAAMKRGLLDANIRRVVALGAPFNGTRWFPFAPPSLRAPFNPNGEWCKDLNDLPEPSALRIVRAQHDQNVRPSRNAALPGIPETVLPHVGHNGLINHPDVFKAVWTFLL